MWRPTRRAASAWCNIARGLGRVLVAALPLPEETHTSHSTNTNTTTNSINKTDDVARAPVPAALPAELVQRLSQPSNERPRTFSYKNVPASRTARALGFTSLFLQVGFDKLRAVGGSAGQELLPLAAHERVSNTLCRMRGAVLKLGQMVSIQDNNTIPASVRALFERARDQAYAMPRSQLDAVMRRAYKNNAHWRTEYFSHFDDTPIAAASIGQVHYARLRPTTGVTADSTSVAHNDTTLVKSDSTSVSSESHAAEGVEVAVKVQYPGVAQSIDADVANLKLLMSIGLLPPGMFVDNILRELRQELQLECQYTLEAAKQHRYRTLVAGDDELNDIFYVPAVYLPLCTDEVLVSEFVRGVPIDQLATRHDIPQEMRNYLAEKIMLLTLRELFSWRFMQTDPNYANFLYDAAQNRINLLDFGAAREYDERFVQDYLDVVAAAARQDTKIIIEKSIALGFLTGREVPEMTEAHVRSVLELGKPFRDRNAPYDFAKENLPARIQANVPTMVKLRLRPPPTPTYSLHRRLSGTILLATKFGATMHSGRVFWDMYDAMKRVPLTQT